MATRQEIQAALDLIRFANVANDLFDVAVKVSRGEVLKTLSAGGPGDVQTQENMTEADIQAHLSRAMDNIQGYTNMIDSYLSEKTKSDMVTNGLAALSVDLKGITDDVQTFKDKIDSVRTELSSADTKEKLASIGTNIEADILNLTLVRNK